MCEVCLHTNCVDILRAFIDDLFQHKSAAVSCMAYLKIFKMSRKKSGENLKIPVTLKESYFNLNITYTTIFT